MKKEKICIEYPLNSTSGNIIWNAVGTSHGLETWFADKVSVHNKQYTFLWGKNEVRVATLVNLRAGVYIRFHWIDEDQGTYFELHIESNELTGHYTLTVTDFCEPGEIDDLKNLWDSQIDTLRRLCGL